MARKRKDDLARRAYWCQQMELAVVFVEKMLNWPVEESMEPFVSLPDAAKEAGVEVTFSTKPHSLGLPRRYFLRQGQIPGFIGAARDMNKRGWVMHVEDGYRSTTMQKYIGRQPLVFDQVLQRCIWELDGKTPTAEFMFRRSMAVIAYCPKVGTHMSGSAIDISVFEKEGGKEVDRGKPYLEMSELTPMTSPFITSRALKNRVAISAIMRKHGFVEYPYEFWHFNSGDIYDRFLTGKGGPGKYGAVDWDPNTGKITPVAKPTDPLNTFDEIRGEIDAALKRLAKPQA